MILAGKTSFVHSHSSSVHFAQSCRAVSVDDIGSPATVTLDLPLPLWRYHSARTHSSTPSYDGVHPTFFADLAPHNHPECLFSSKQPQEPKSSGGADTAAAAAAKVVAAGQS